MIADRAHRIRLRRGFPALLAVAALSIGACSASSDKATTDSGKSSTTAAGKSTSNSSTDTKPTGDAVEPTSLLPIDADAPDGYRMVTPRCDATDAAAKADDATSDEIHRSGIIFAVPDPWKSMGSGSAGSGSVMGTDADVDFELTSGERIEVAYDWDSRTMNGEIADATGKPWKTFDYESTTGDDTTVITYDKVATVTIGDQDVDLSYRDPAQAPDDLSEAQYKARIDAVELPKSAQMPDVSDVRSFVVTIAFDADAPVTQDVVEKIVGSFSMPTCTWDELLASEELRLQIDLDGDGKVRSAADAQKEIQEKLDDLKKEQQARSDD